MSDPASKVPHKLRVRTVRSPASTAQTSGYILVCVLVAYVIGFGPAMGAIGALVMDAEPGFISPGIVSVATALSQD
jgi:hypothetical protein